MSDNFSISEIEQARRTTAALEGGRRIRRYCMRPEIIADMLTHGKQWRVTNGIPVGAAFRGFTIDHASNKLAIWLEHESFTPMSSGMHALDGPDVEMERID